LSAEKAKPKAIERAPLPFKVLSAKTIYLQNNSGEADMADRAYTQLKEWGRYQVVDVKEKADIIMVLSETTEQTEGTEASHTSSYNYKTGAWTQGTVTVPDTVTWRFSRVTLVDPSTGDLEWSDQLVQRRKYSATQELIKALRDRVEKQEKAAASSSDQH
jgi:hypothetical protein